MRSYWWFSRSTGGGTRQSAETTRQTVPGHVVVLLSLVEPMKLPIQLHAWNTAVMSSFSSLFIWQQSEKSPHCTLFSNGCWTQSPWERTGTENKRLKPRPKGQSRTSQKRTGSQKQKNKKNSMDWTVTVIVTLQHKRSSKLRAKTGEAGFLFWR